MVYKGTHRKKKLDDKIMYGNLVKNYVEITNGMFKILPKILTFLF